MNFRCVLRTSIAAFVLLGSGCSDSSSESQENAQIWGTMVQQAEQMRAEELRTDIEHLHNIEATGDKEAFESERGQICKKWSNVERLSPTPVKPGFVPELIPVPTQLPC